MSAALRRAMTVAEFLAWEAGQELRYEFDGLRPIAMTGGTAGHAAIQRKLITALAIRLRGGPRQAFSSHLKVAAAHSIRYPDTFVVCSPVANDATVVTDPIKVFEILSPGTSGVDRIVKNQEYRDTPSIRRYVIMEQTHQAATVFERQGSDWIGHVVAGETELPMPEIPITLPLAELYSDVTFPPEAEAG